MSTSRPTRPVVPPLLRGVVESLWYVEDAPEDQGAPGLELKLPSPRAQLLVNLTGTSLGWRDPATGVRHETAAVALAGIGSRSVLLDRTDQRSLLGVVLAPTAISTVLGRSAESVEDPLVPFVHPGAAPLVESDDPAHALATLLRLLLPVARRTDPGLAAATAHLEAGAPVAAVREKTGMSTTTFTRRFRAAVGVTPKRFQRVARLARVMGARREGDAGWAELAVLQGYADQTHLAHEFTDLAGITASAYDRRVSPAGALHLRHES